VLSTWDSTKWKLDLALLARVVKKLVVRAGLDAAKLRGPFAPRRARDQRAE